MAGSTGSFATSVPAGDALARKLFSVALFAQTQKTPGFSRSLTGPAPDAKDAINKLKAQTAADMPVVRITDLSKTAGDTVSVDIFGTVGGKPIMGDGDAEGTGAKLDSASMDIAINLTTKVVDAGGKMSQQRTVHQLRTIAMANLVSYFSRLDDQTTLVHLAGARGDQNGEEWIVPLDTDADFDAIMINDVKAPSVGSHWVVDGTGIVTGATATNITTALGTTDKITLAHIDALRTILDEADFPLQPVKIADDPAAADDPMWVLYVSPRQWSDLLAETSGIRAFHQNAWNRASYGSKHPLFKGEVGMWNGILVKKLNRAIRFNSAGKMKHIATANAATGTETELTLPTITGYAVDRAILLGAQALGNAYGKNKASEYHFDWLENPYNFGRAMEVAGDCMGGKAKLRFKLPNKNIVDHGVMVLDSVVKL